MASNGKNLGFPDLQTKQLTGTGAAKKRKYAAMCENSDFYNIQPATFDVVHPSEIDPSDWDVEVDDVETVHNSFPKQTGSTGVPALPSPKTAPSTGLSSGAKAGIAVGAIVGVAIIAGLAFLLFRERRKRKALAQSEKPPMGYSNNGYGYGNMGSQQIPAQQHQMPPSELGAYKGNEHKYHYRGELGDGQGRPSELHP
ncbi:MAG: hypothetical protein Q9209_004752 [Squamulea sp. 1 TL-2023]